MSRINPKAVLAFALGIASGCSFLVDDEKKQCSDTNDCKDLNEDLPLVCLDNLCQLEEGKQCATSNACPQGNLCDTTINQCVKVAKCAENDDCKKFDGADDFICLKEACEPPQCVADLSCIEEFGEGFECKDGLCDNPAWGCADDPDPRTGEDGEGVFKVRVLHISLAQQLTPLVNPQARTCIPADPKCPGDDAADGGGNPTFDEDGWLTLSGLRKQKYVLRVTGYAPDGVTPVLPATLFMQRPVVGENIEPEPMLMFSKSTRDNFGPVLEVPTESDKMGLLIARVFDCQKKNAAGVIVDFNLTERCPTLADCQTTSFYFDDQNFPHKDFQATDGAGVAGIINMKPGVTNVISFTRQGFNDPYAQVEVVPTADEVTYTVIYPGKY